MKALTGSRTFWLGFAEILIGVLEYVAGRPAPIDYHAVIMIVAGVLTIIVRKLTTGPVVGVLKVPANPALPK
jgi:hypothetical protein